VNGDLIFEQVQTDYDAAGNVISTTTRQRMDTADSTTGALGDLTTQPKARITRVGHWCDGIGRQTAVADYGTTPFTRTAQPTAPDRGDSVLVSSIEYDARGQGYKTIDPAGREDRQDWDDAGRRVKTVQNYKECGSGPDENVTVEFTYNADGVLLTQEALWRSACKAGPRRG
jgi:YD repeat-containing protein